MQDRRYSWLVSLCLAALFAFPHAAFRYRASIRLLVDFDIMVEACGLKPPVLQVYYDQGRGFVFFPAGLCSWQEKNWNLCSSTWQYVAIPIRKQ